MVRMIMHGCNGKMGQVISDICREDSEIEIVAGIDPYTGKENPYPVFSELEKCRVEADVVVDFAAAFAVDGLLDYCVNRRLPVVLCTTGLSEAQLAKVEETGSQVAVLKSANMSLGVNTLMDLLENAAKVLAPAGFDIEIVEKHHNQGFPARNLAASTAPFPKIALEYAVCLISITSSIPAKITSCSPTILPPLTAWIPISFLSRFFLSCVLSYLYSYA